MIKDKNYYIRMKKIGEQNERDFAYILRATGHSFVEISKGRTSEWDVRAISPKGEKLYFEVKTNRGVEEWGTIFVEYEQSGKASGMNKTVADWQIHYDEKGRCGCITTKALHKYIEDNNIQPSHTRRKNKKGKPSGSGYRVPWDILEPVK